MLTKLRERPKGSVLLLVLFLLIVLAMMGSAFSILLPVEMQNAKRDRANIQTAYAADAAVLWVMNQLDDNDNLRQNDQWETLEGETQVLSKEWEWRVASVERLNGDEAYKVVTEGIRVRGSQKDVLRRAVAIIDNAWEGKQAAIINLATEGNESPMGSNNCYWPGDVPIYGDAIVLGRWAVDPSGFVGLTEPVFTGTITQTKDGGNGVRGEDYAGNSPLAAEDYGDVYTRGLEGVRTADVADLEDLYMDADGARENLQQYLFGTEESATLTTMNTTVKNTNGIHLSTNDAGTLTGGFTVNSGNDLEIAFSVDGNGNSIMTYNTGSNLTIDSINTSSPSTLSAPPGTAPTGQAASTFQIIHATDDPTYGAGDRVVIKNGSTIIYNGEADFSQGVVVYNIGSIEAQGTFTGEKTVGASQGVTVTGELLKAGLPRGMSTTEAINSDTVSDADKALIQNSLLGLVSYLDAQNQSEGFRFDIQSQPVTGDNNVYIHASMMGGSKTNANAKMFGHNINQGGGNKHMLFPNAELSFYGQLATSQTNAGQYSKEMAFIAAAVKEVHADDVPIGFPTNIEGFTPRLRAYVDQQSFETE